MISITKEEKGAIKEAYPNTHIVRTMKQKSKRHKYYCEESSQVIRFLNESRNRLKTNPSRGDDYHIDRKV